MQKYTKSSFSGLLLNPIALRTAKTLWSFGCSECNRVRTFLLFQNKTRVQKEAVMALPQNRAIPENLVNV